ncbi:MAG: hypothetical protein AABX47_02995 [Nanoarchaeota archaeon]
MTIEFVLPFGRPSSVKNLVFSILSYEHPLKLVELTNLIRKRYGRQATFQAVRKAAIELAEEGILEKTGDGFQIDVNWVSDVKNSLDKLHTKLRSKEIRPESIRSIDGDISVFTFTTLNDLMKFWEQIIDDWYKKFKEGDHGVNCWQGSHIWEALLHLDTERKVMEQLKRKKIKSYAVVYSDTPLDRYIRRFYSSIGLQIRNIPSQSEFDNSYHVGTYGDLIVQAHYPKELVKKINAFFRNTRTFDDMDVKRLHDIVSTKTKIKLTVIRNLEMAKQINKSIIEQIE